jgi:hypothetical protein
VINGLGDPVKLLHWLRHLPRSGVRTTELTLLLEKKQQTQRKKSTLLRVTGIVPKTVDLKWKEEELPGEKRLGGKGVMVSSVMEGEAALE